MIIIPAIDIYDKKAVRLYKGDYNQMTVYSERPEDVAMHFKDCGAKEIHVVDLEGAKSGKPENAEIVESIIKKTGLKVEVGGGIRSLETVRLYLENGIDTVILGTAALNDKYLLLSALEKYGSRITVGIDAKNGKVSVSGWLSDSEVNYIDLAVECEKNGVENIIFTDIGRDGSLEGPNFGMLAELKSKCNCRITASGGIKSVDDIKKLRDMGMYGAICGKSLYSGTLTLSQALEAAGE